MTHYRDSILSNFFYSFSNTFSTFKLYRCSMRFLQYSSCISESVISTKLIRHKRHINNYHCTVNTFCYSFRVINHFIHCYGQSSFVSLKNVAQRIANKDNIYSCFIKNFSSNKIVSGKCSNSYLILF